MTAVLIVYLSDKILPGEWPMAGVLLGIAMAGGSIFQYSQTSRHRQAESQFGQTFPGYSGERIPICALLRFEGPQGLIDFDPNGAEFSLGVSPRYLFVIRHGKSPDPREPGGSLVIGPDGRPLRIRRDEIVDVKARPFGDAQIAASGQQPGEWLSNMVTSGLFGASVKTMPWAALVFILVAGDEGPSIFRIGIPTELPDTALRALGSAVTGAISDQVQDFALGEIAEEFGEFIGQDAADLLLGAGGLSLGALPSSSDGRKGRLMAALLAARIRQLKLD
ncbi:MAG TPA: hypothetical protein VF548_01230 [Allosphingosinicella sp.]|jgi:hypothetical protein